MLDQIWEDASALKNTAYQAIHEAKIQESWEILKGNILQKNYWDEFIRWILSFFESFQKIEIVEKISSLDASKILEIPA